MGLGRLKNKMIAALFTRFPSLARRAAANVEALTFDTTPWTELPGPLSELRISMATTAGVHLKTDTPFNMQDETGDPTFRVIPSSTPFSDMTITHDYYDHKDADKDMNIVFPMDRLREYVEEGRIGSLSDRYYGFMGHILENHIDDYVGVHIPKVAAMMKEDKTDVALITPG